MKKIEAEESTEHASSRGGSFEKSRAHDLEVKGNFKVTPSKNKRKNTQVIKWLTNVFVRFNRSK